MNKSESIRDKLLSVLLFSVFLVLPITRYNIYFESLGFSLNLFLILFPILLIWVVVRGYWRNLLFIDRYKFVFLLLLCSIILSDFASSFFAYNVEVTQLSFVYRLIGYLFCWTIFSLVYSKPFSRNRYLVFSAWWGIISSSLVVSFIGIWQFLAYKSSSSLPLVNLEGFLNSRNLRLESFRWEVGGEILLRPSSTFFDPNNSAGFLSAAILVSSAMLIWLWIQNKKEKTFDLVWLIKLVIVAISVLSNLILFLMQGSRSAILGFVGAFVVIGFILFIEKRYRKYVYRVGMGLLGFLILISILMSDLFSSLISKFVGISDYSNTSDVSRVVFAEGAIEAFKSNVFLGIGIGNFEEFFINTVNPAYSMAHTHSAYLTFLSETGIFGFFTNVLWMIILLYLSLVFVKGLIKLSVNWRMLLLMSLIGVVVSISLGNIFYGYYPSTFWTWGYFGLLLGLSELKSTA